MQIEVHLKVFIVLKKTITSIKENEILFGWNVWKIKSFFRWEIYIFNFFFGILNNLLKFRAFSRPTHPRKPTHYFSERHLRDMCCEVVVKWWWVSKLCTATSWRHFALHYYLFRSIFCQLFFRPITICSNVVKTWPEFPSVFGGYVTECNNTSSPKTRKFPVFWGGHFIFPKCPPLNVF